MDVGEFSRALESLTAEDVHRIAATLTNNHSENAADEVEAWRVTLTIDRVLRRTHRTRLAVDLQVATAYFCFSLVRFDDFVTSTAGLRQRHLSERRTALFKGFNL